MWTKVRIKIVSHPRLVAGEAVEALRDEQGHFYVDTKNGAETVYAWECEELPVCDCVPGHICDMHGEVPGGTAE